MKTNHHQLSTMLLAVAMLTLPFLSARYVQAGTILQDKTDGSCHQILHNSPIGQTFTAEDATIQSIGFKVGDYNPGYGPIALTVELFKGVGTGGLSLGSSPITGLTPGFNGFGDADFSFVTLTVGQIYTAILSSTSARGAVYSYWWAYPDGTPYKPDPYIGGDMFYTGNLKSYGDLTFRVVVPEPASAFLVIAGMGLFRLRREKKLKVIN